jgi:hypothetical protein
MAQLLEIAQSLKTAGGFDLDRCCIVHFFERIGGVRKRA